MEKIFTEGWNQSATAEMSSSTETLDNLASVMINYVFLSDYVLMYLILHFGLVCFVLLSWPGHF